MLTFTKEQLIASAHARIEFAEMMLAGELEPLKERTWTIELELARIALASLEAEPVEYVDPFAFNNFSVYRTSNTDNKRMGREWMWANPDAGLIPVYTAPPAPAVPDAIPKLKDGQRFKYVKDGIRYSANYANGWNACRDVMLHGADGNSPVIPDGWVACSERMPEGMVTVITSNGFDTGHGWWDGDCWQTWTYHDAVPGDVTHWQPLPSPPLK